MHHHGRAGIEPKITQQHNERGVGKRPLVDGPLKTLTCTTCKIEDWKESAMPTDW
jgi:hypothetical protein